MPRKVGSITLASVAKGRVKRVEMSAVVTRVDGTVEDLGVIAFSDFTFAGRVRHLVTRLGEIVCRKR